VHIHDGEAEGWGEATGQDCWVAERIVSNSRYLIASSVSHTDNVARVVLLVTVNIAADLLTPVKELLGDGSCGIALFT